MVTSGESTPRWTATITYRTATGIIDVTHDLVEIEDLHDIVEQGPSFYAIDNIMILPTFLRAKSEHLDDSDTLKWPKS